MSDGCPCVSLQGAFSHSMDEGMNECVDEWPGTRISGSPPWELQCMSFTYRWADVAGPSAWHRAHLPGTVVPSGTAAGRATSWETSRLVLGTVFSQIFRLGGVILRTLRAVSMEIGRKVILLEYCGPADRRGSCSHGPFCQIGTAVITGLCRSGGETR